MGVTIDQKAIAVLADLEANLLQAADDIRACMTALADRDLTGEPLLTPDGMMAGGWVRLIGENRWRQIRAIGYCGLHGAACRTIDLKGINARQHVDRATTLPFLTAEQFEEDCEREQRDAEDAAGLERSLRDQRDADREGGSAA